MNSAAIHREFADARDQLTGLYQPDIGSSTLRGEATHSPPRERIPIVAINTDFQSSLALVLGEAGFEVMTATTGEQAFRLLRDWRRLIDWLYTQVTLPGLIDGWILADQHRNNHPDRPAIIGAREVGYSAQGDIVLKEPTAAVVLDAIRHITVSAQPQARSNPLEPTRRALPYGKAPTDTDDPGMGHQSRGFLGDAYDF
jgi:CheY-like chemotaxis protein